MNKARYPIILIAFILLGCSPRIVNLDAKGTSIVCFGDSLTQGVGARIGEDYPSLLRRKVSRRVINVGIAGNTTFDALKRIEIDVLAHDPKMVIVMLGGNDFFRKLPKEETLANIESIITRIQERGAIVALVPVKMGLVWNVYVKEFEAIAKKKGALFIPNAMDGILTDPKLKYDRIHPNTAGYRLIAERIYKAIAPLL